MNKRQIIQHAKNYMDALSRGINPIDHQPVRPGSELSEPRLQKCFAFVSEILEEVLQTGGLVALPDDGDGAPHYEVVRKKTAFRLEAAQRQRVYISPKPVTPATFVGHINRTVDAGLMEKLSLTRVNAWLLKNDYVTRSVQPTLINRTVLSPTERAAAIGIGAEEVADARTGELKPRLLLSERAQVFLLDNLDSILEED